ncbi:MAG: hypothetical protein DMG88_20600 [Acidobacteria bacterium]|nr:MAG: hypothetical protein DMG88_20600 [Acidobacteriota bacterium]
MSLVFCAIPSASLPFAHLEVALNQILHLRQTDLIRGHFEIWIPSLMLALCTWSLFRLARGLSLTKEVLRSAAGVVIVLCPSAIWTCGYERNGWSLQWPYKMVLSEPVLALICVWLFLTASRAAARWIGISAFLVHSLFWYWFTSDGFHSLEWGIPGYGGPAGLILGFCSALVWGLYIRELRRTCVNTKTVHL